MSIPRPWRLLIILALVTFASSYWVTRSRPRLSAVRLAGKILRVEGNGIEVFVPGATAPEQHRLVSVPPDTAIQGGTLQDLKPEREVELTGIQRGDGQVDAIAIVILPSAK